MLQSDKPRTPAATAGKKRNVRVSAKPRKTQAERSEAMRVRLIDATIECLAKDGYAGTTVSKIATRAKVSNGASGHHFETKSDLILAATEALIHQAYRSLDELAEAIENKDRLAALIEVSWAKFHSQPAMKALLEIAVTAQRDKALAKVLEDLNRHTDTLFEQAANLLFEAVPGNRESPHAMFALSRSLLLGLAVQLHSGSSEAAMREQIGVWVRMMGTLFRARPVVPPKDGIAVLT